MDCPACHSLHFESNHIDETPFVAAAHEAVQLRHFGQIESAREQLMRLAAIRIENFLALRWKCPCGARFDG